MAKLRFFVDVSTPGDSGAAMYATHGASGAYALGMVIGAVQDDVLWHKTSDIEAHLGITIALP